MTKEEKIVYLQSQIACANIRLEAMKAENEAGKINGTFPAYTQFHFSDVIEDYGLGSNQVIEFLKD